METADYILVSSERLFNTPYEDIVTKVNRLIGQGYRPLGGIVVLGRGTVCQAMVKDSNAEIGTREEMLERQTGKGG